MNAPSPALSVFSARGFASLWAARDVSAVGNWILFAGVLAWSYRAKESAAVLSILVLAQMLPPFLLGPLADRIVNWRNGQVVGIAALLLRAAALVPLLGVRTEADLQLAITSLLLAAVPTAFAGASHRLLLSGLVAPDRRTGPRRALSVTALLTPAAGPAAAVFLFEMQGVQGCVAAAVLAQVLGAALLLFARPAGASALSGDIPPAAVGLAALPRGLGYALGHPPLQTVAVLLLVVPLVTGGLVIAQVGYLVWGLFSSAESIGAVLAAQGSGIAVGVGAHHLVRRRVLPSSLASVALGITAAAAFGFAISRALPAAVAFSALLGLGHGMLMLSLTSLVPRLAGEGWERSASASLDATGQAMALLSVIALGPLTDAISPRFAIVLVSIILIVLALYAFGSVPDSEVSERKDSEPVMERTFSIARPA